MPDDIPTTSYVNFDGLNLKEAIRERLTSTGIFTDQNYEGSNLTHFNEIISFIFGNLLFYLNKTSNEGLFTEAALYENVNRIVKQLDYKPVGHQSSTLSFTASASDLNSGLYTIPRFSFIEVGGIKYSFNKDVTFSKSVNSTLEELTDMSREHLLYQGYFIEHPIVKALGNDNEIVFLTIDDNTIIDHFNIKVYIKNSTTGTWQEWENVQSLYVSKYDDIHYELRYNENKRYELRFGNNINGKKLNIDDQIAIYYLKSDGKSGEVGANVLSSKKLKKYSTTRLNEIIADTTTDQYNEISNTSVLRFNNSCVSSYYSKEEEVSSIKENAPGVFRSQYRVVTNNDYEVFIKTNFSNLIQDVKILNNSEYLQTYMKYFTDLGLLNSNLESRALFNQVNFADACNFNNVYAFVVPKTIGSVLTYVNPSQKELIIDTIKEEKILTSELILLDPVYLEFDIGLGDSSLDISDVSNSYILVEKDPKSKRNDSAIREDIAGIIDAYFNRKYLTLGQTININQLTVDILSVKGVDKFYTYRQDLGTKVDGLRMIYRNPAYITSIKQAVSNVKLENFQFAYLKPGINYVNKIIIESTSNTKFEGAEY